MYELIKRLLQKRGVCYHPWYRYSEAARHLFLYERFKAIPDGDIVECGVGHGRSLVSLATFVRYEDKGRKVYGYDTFMGVSVREYRLFCCSEK